jgi:hypothetical protein
MGSCPWQKVSCHPRSTVSLLAFDAKKPPTALLTQQHRLSQRAAIALPLLMRSTVSTAVSSEIAPAKRTKMSVSFDEGVGGLVSSSGSEATVVEEEEKVGRFLIANLNNSIVARADSVHAPKSWGLPCILSWPTPSVRRHREARLQPPLSHFRTIIASSSVVSNLLG